MGLLTQFEHKPIPPRADAEARARGPPLAADQKKKNSTSVLAPLSELSAKEIPPAALKLEGRC